MRLYHLAAAFVGCATMAGCGGSDNASGGPPPVATPTATPTPAPTASPTPAPSYTTFDALTGDLSFATACAGFVPRVVDPVPIPATRFGEGLSLDYDAATQSYFIAGNGQSVTFDSGDRDTSAPSNTPTYRHDNDGFTERFIIRQPSADGIRAHYARSFLLLALASGGVLEQYVCVFGVPTFAGDRPAANFITFASVSVSGTAIVAGNSAAGQYELSNSIANFQVDLTSGIVTSDITLRGRLLGPDGPVPEITELGEYQGSADFDDSETGYYGTYQSSDPSSVASQFGGWFFGPQGIEAAYAFSITADDAAGGRVIAAGRVFAIR